MSQTTRLYDLRLLFLRLKMAVAKRIYVNSENV